MKGLIALFAAILIFCSCVSVAEGGKKWAFLVAGSRLYQNYRHQADVAHAFQVMKKNGIPLENIIVMMYDDIAHHHLNPFPGNLINEPHGPNVYTGIKVDYRGNDVTAENFLKVLQGDAEGMKGIGTGRVIESTSEDNVFVYYADHGNKGLIAFPKRGSLYSKDLLAAIDNMHQKNKYKKMVFYIEACYSGSMFIRRLPKDIGVYAFTAANDHESSWACFFDDKRRTSLADEFSIRWMKDTEGHSTSKRTLAEQYESVKKLVKFSHPSLFGDTDGMGGMAIGDFQGNSGSSYNSNATTGVVDVDVGLRVKQWDVPYMSLLLQLQGAATTQHRLEILKEMIHEEEMKQRIQQSLISIAGKFVRKPLLMMRPKSLDPSLAEDECYEQCITKYEKSCYHFDEYSYALRDLHMFSNLCHRGVSIQKIHQAIDEVCSVKRHA